MNDGYWLNKLFFDTQNPEALVEYRRDRTAYLTRYPLSASAHAALDGDDVTALWRVGVNPYLLRFYCRGIGMSEEVYLTGLRAALPETAPERTRG